MVFASTEITQNLNTFRAGYGEELSLYPKRINDKWSIQFGVVARSVGSLLEEGRRTARKLADCYPNELDIYFSGGIDSEFMIHCFIQENVNFRILTCRFKNDLNKHDMQYVEDFKKKYPQLKYEEISIDIEEFLSSEEMSVLAYDSKCTLPHLLLLMKLAKQSKRAVVFATGEPYIVKQNELWHLRERESVSSLYRYFNMHKIKGTHAFFQFNAEIFYSFLQDPVINELAKNRIIGKTSSMSSRQRVYNQYIEIVERPKFHGYERIENQIGNLQLKLEKLYPHFQNVQYFSYEQLLNDLGLKK